MSLLQGHDKMHDFMLLKEKVMISMHNMGAPLLIMACRSSVLVKLNINFINPITLSSQCGMLHHRQIVEATTILGD